MVSMELFDALITPHTRLVATFKSEDMHKITFVKLDPQFVLQQAIPELYPDNFKDIALAEEARDLGLDVTIPAPIWYNLISETSFMNIILNELQVDLIRMNDFDVFSYRGMPLNLRVSYGNKVVRVTAYNFMVLDIYPTCRYPDIEAHLPKSWIEALDVDKKALLLSYTEPVEQHLKRRREFLKAYFGL